MPSKFVRSSNSKLIPLAKRHPALTTLFIALALAYQLISLEACIQGDISVMQMLAVNLACGLCISALVTPLVLYMEATWLSHGSK